MLVVLERHTLGGEVANHTSSDTENDAGPRGQETRSGRSSDETRDSTGAPADHGPLASQAPIEENPSCGSEHGSDVGVPAGNDSAEVGTEGATTIEAQPTKPEEDGAEGDEGDVVGAEVEHHLLLAAAKDPGIGERRKTGDNLDGTSASIVQHTPLESPAVDVPHPACNGAVYDRGPEEDEDHHGNETSAFGDTSDDNGGSDGAELHLWSQHCFTVERTPGHTW